MNAAYHAVLITLRTGLELLDETVAGLPDEALDWVPAEGANSVAVLVRHSVTATAFLAATGAGLAPDREAYVTRDRASAFAAREATVDGLRAEIAQLLEDIGPILGAGRDDVLEKPALWAWGDGRTPNCSEVLVHSLGHLKEHVGQVQLMRDLWNARPAGA
jgi:hypothetical protein